MLALEIAMSLLKKLKYVRTSTIFVTLLSALLACSSIQPEKTIPLPGEPVAAFPQMTTGDQWKVSTGQGLRLFKVIDVTADGCFTVEIQNEDGSVVLHRFYDNNYLITKEINMTTGAIIKVATPPAQNLNFPLFVGKKWADEYSALGSDNKFKTFKNSYEVEKFETISTPAGDYNTFKITRKYNPSDMVSTRTLYQYYWYSPELKIVIKLQHSNETRTASGYLIHTELLSYQKASADKKTLQTDTTPTISIEKDNTAGIIDGKASGYKKESSVEKTSVAVAKWAVLIGISQYKDTRIAPLRYAAADAQSLYDWIVSPQGGKYAPSMVKLLTDADATGVTIKKVLFEWLTQAIEEDTVTIYFAGHGSPQSPDHPENLFLLPYDTQYDSVPTTGFPMWDIETALKRFIKAKKVIVITDACHAGGVGQGFDVARRSGRGLTTVPVSSSLQNLSRISEGVCIISASDDNQLSQESAQWGGGHGVFTFHLLEGLKGKADYSKDGIVTLGELIPFLSEQVRRETRNAQTPTVAGRFDPALTIGK